MILNIIGINMIGLLAWSMTMLMAAVNGFELSSAWSSFPPFMLTIFTASVLIAACIKIDQSGG